MTQEFPLRKNDKIELEITSVASTGNGIGRYNGLAVFVAGAAPGDTVECLIIKVKNSYAIGKIVSIIKASPNRIVPDCRVFPRCGGCNFRHISYDAEKRIKQQKVEDAFKRIGHLDIAPQPICGADCPERYRNKAQYPVQTVNGRLMAGFYAPLSHRVVDCKDCLLQPEGFANILKAVAKWAEKYKIPTYNEETKKGLLRHIYIRKGFVTGETMVCLVINGDKIFKADKLIEAVTSADNSVCTVLLNHNTQDTNVILGDKCTALFGKGYIEDILCGVRFRISPLSFYQVNHDQAQRLYEKAAEYALEGKPRTIMDLYCGAGTIGLTMADKAEMIYGVEIVPEAVEDAKINAEINGIRNAEFMCMDASKAAEELKNRGVKPDCVIIDPPRKGCDEALLHTINEMSPERIVYVSCDPATLARDCEILSTMDWRVREATPFDLFPRTVHVETVALLSRNTPDNNIGLENNSDE